MSAKFTPTADYLRELLPYVARNMDRELITEQMRNLNIKFKARTEKGSLVFEVPMEPHHMMRITAITDFTQESNLYIRYQPERQTRNNREEPSHALQETVSAQIEIFDQSLGEDAKPMFFTFSKKNMEAVLAAGMLSFYRINGVKMMPIKRPGIRRTGSN
jgi:hypothetical protein